MLFFYDFDNKLTRTIRLRKNVKEFKMQNALDFFDRLLKYLLKIDWLFVGIFAKFPILTTLISALNQVSWI